MSNLKRYKHRAEWFRPEELRKFDDLYPESELVIPLYEFLFDQGIEFSIEPKSLHGRIDIIGPQLGDGTDRLMIEAKVFRENPRGNNRTRFATDLANCTGIFSNILIIEAISLFIIQLGARSLLKVLNL